MCHKSKSMKKITLIGMAALMLGIGTLNTGCMGSWKLTTSLYSWNKSVTGNKYLNNIIFWILHAIPAYEICYFADIIILNTIEFWTGSNPIAMNAGEKEQQIVKGKDGNNYEITATQNRFDIVSLNNKNKTSIIYTPMNHTWNMDKNGIVTKLATIHEDINKVEIFKADGSVAMIDMNEAQMNKIWQTGLSN